MARRGVASLLEENRQLRLHVKGSEAARQRVEMQMAELQRRVGSAEAAAAQQLRRKEVEWMAEYDRSVQALLEIVKHHEQEKAQLEQQVQQLRAAAAVGPPPITKMARSTQTETPKPTRTAARRNSVRFAKEGDTTSDKEESAYMDAKMRQKLVHMQRLFDQLQVSKCQHDSRSVDQPNGPADNRTPACGHSERPPVRPNHDLKAAVLERLRHIQPASTCSAARRRSPVTAALSGEIKSIETQTDEAPALKQDTCSTTIQQGLEERNRLLHERLASHQKLLDELLYTKLKHASVGVDRVLRGRPQRSPRTASDPVKECEVVDQGDKRIKCNQLLPTTDIESAGTADQRPLSPAAA